MKPKFDSLPALKEYLLGENKEIDRELADLASKASERERKKAANLNLIAGIDQREQIESAPTTDTASATNGAIVRPSFNGAAPTHAPSAPAAEYGALRKTIRAACRSMVRFNLDDIAAKCPAIDRTVLANSLWNLEKIGDIKIIERVGEGRKAKRIYENAPSE